jgi:hypothetical protein
MEIPIKDKPIKEAMRDSGQQDRIRGIQFFDGLCSVFITGQVLRVLE